MKDEMERLIGRAVTNKEFRDKVLANPEQAARDGGFNLSADEIDSLKQSVAKISANSSTAEIDKQFSASAAAWWA
jgi:hypothetical protein